jgi:type II secretory pathway component PulF
MTPSSVQIYWLILPLVIAISLVYSASRHESWRRIWWHSLRLSLWIMGLLVIATGVLLLINTQV